ncbi:type I-MYXAN CRISPR-associated protein Cas6/Cmx6 [Leptolyngbya sp. FACHB-261]|uniref:type I-MYXAN CRISPR-associated protein Cas6/Cmx6 n=1 Tax=Leptolyngbya sp. FACHB-261 TaxID=2692806 RepID=UPI0016857B08|nr:type I-MYXAN CRISPR-associated protein Cas6/Cmx6 [Leptolyngbya sp. FACHB-261]MBD2101765.1 type I-MYXAN CRISPR-associated protein Cas6/Cmx6 [Leptolyngbya sp. FACHB-261]
MNSITRPLTPSAENRGFEPFVELDFPVINGQVLPADHNYGLYAAFVHLIPELRQHPELAILTVPGIKDQQGKIHLTRQSLTRIRVPISKIPLVYPLAGKKVKVGVHEIQLGIPTVSMLCPAPTVRARIVTIKGAMELGSFIASAQRQLDNLGIVGHLSVPLNRDGQPSRKVIKIQRYTVVGFTTEVTGLSDEHSLLLQQFGCGGKRHMGCGIFLPHQEH